MLRAEQKRRRRISNPLGLALLALLFERAMHPYEMAATLRQRAKDESIRLNYGSLYTVIGALERAGFIAAGEKVRQGLRPERTVYTITDKGELELFDWMRDLLSAPVKEYPHFEAALSLLGVMPPDEAKTLLESRLHALDDEIRQSRRIRLEALGQGLPRLFLIEGEYAETMCEAERKWVAGLVRLIETSPDFTREWRAWHERRRESEKPARPRRKPKPGSKNV